MPLLPDDVTPEEVAELRMPKGLPARRPNIVLPGEPPIFREHGTARGRALVIVVGGRWLIQCPTCPQRVPAHTPAGGRVELFRCPLCHNSAAGKRPFPVLWPSRAQADRIAMVLRCRPDPQTRNWVPGESLHMLCAENIQHGCAVPALSEA